MEYAAAPRLGLIAPNAGAKYRAVRPIFPPISSAVPIPCQTLTIFYQKYQKLY